ncbi:MAG: hypothetical protein N4A72_07715 [Bacteroidales bacterium]|nr:hypothetical protein [Bacteroidales bacterium]
MEYCSLRKKRDENQERVDLIRYINMKLASMGQPIFEDTTDVADNSMSEQAFVGLSQSLLDNYKEKMRLLSTEIINPADTRIQSFINDYLKEIDFDKDIRIPFDSFVLDKKGIGREVSLPPNGNEFSNDIVKSYRIRQGVLHNPKHDRRTTKGSFHIVEGGMAVPYDKKEVPKLAWANMMHVALNPPEDSMELPFTANQDSKAKVWTSLFMRPTVCPEIPGYTPRKSMEIRFFAPGSMVSNLDFVESIFGNAGDPYLFQNDSGLDVEHWTGTTGCIILAPHLIYLTKKELGLPNVKDATERQKRDGMCWSLPNEKYNGGQPFKITCRDHNGVVITLIADNYYGYSKKEIKTQISYSANLLGLCEEEHAGGTLVFLRRNVGEKFSGSSLVIKSDKKFSLELLKENYSDMIDFSKGHYGIDKRFPNILYVPEDANFDLYKGQVSWMSGGVHTHIKMLMNHYYVFPSGHKIHMERHPFAPEWRLVLTNANGSYLHKPSTVSGGGKSEISKSLSNAIIYGTFFIDDIDKDFAKVDEILAYDYSKRWKEGHKDQHTEDSKPIMAFDKSLVSVINLLTPYDGYSEEYDEYLSKIPDHIKALVFLIKKISIANDGATDWRNFFTVDTVNGRKGHCLMFDNRKIITSYLRVGFDQNESWFVHSLRPDFIAAAKVQMEDDISSSVTVPASVVDYNAGKSGSVKIVENCENRFFQRPDEAVNRGYDKEAEEDLSRRDNFTTNYEPLSPKDGQEIIDDAIQFDKYTDPIKDIIRNGANDKEGRYFISTSHPRRLSDGSVTKNPRYLQDNPNTSSSIDTYMAKLGIKLYHGKSSKRDILFPITDVLPGRRNNPSDKEAGIRPLSVYNPIHYQDTPELFMDFICSLTGKSPSTTGAGSEGALTKGPFNMLQPTIDLNNALISHILCGHNGFTTAAGYIGSKRRFDHDISILVPELWARIKPEEKDPKLLIEEGALEKVNDFEYEGETIPASRLGYRITREFVFRHLGRIFEEPMGVFTEDVLKPETQCMEDYVDGIKNVVEAQQKSALMYFEDGSIDLAIPPLKVLLHIMAYGHYEGKGIEDKELRELFTREYVLNSDWYKERLACYRDAEIKRWEKRVNYIIEFGNREVNQSILDEIKINDKLEYCKSQLALVKSKKYTDQLVGTIGLTPMK